MSEHFTYRGIGFQKTPKGHWLFDTTPDNGCFWSRFAKDGELPFLDGTCNDTDRVHQIIRNMIDRQIAGHIQYRGDMRYR